MKNKTATNSMKFNKFSSIALLDGLDTFLNLSIVTYLSIFSKNLIIEFRYFYQHPLYC